MTLTIGRQNSRAAKVAHRPDLLACLQGLERSNSGHARFTDFNEILRLILNVFVANFGQRIEWMVVDDYTADELRDSQRCQSARGLRFCVDASSAREADVAVLRALPKIGSVSSLVAAGYRWRGDPRSRGRSSANAPCPYLVVLCVRGVLVSIGGPMQAARLVGNDCVPLMEVWSVESLMAYIHYLAAAWLDALAIEFPCGRIVHRDSLDAQ